MKSLLMIKKIYRKLIPKNIRSFVDYFRVSVKLLVKVEHMGDLNKDKKFVVIQPSGLPQGPGSIITDRIDIIIWADKWHLIPVMDFRNASCIQDEENRGTENAWTYYFKQPVMDVPLNEVYKSRKVIVLPEGFYPPTMGGQKVWEDFLPSSPAEYKKWSKIFLKYIKLQPEIEELVNKNLREIFPAGKRVLGVSIRASFRAGAEKNYSLYNGHPKVASCEYYLNIVKEKMIKWKCDYIFLQIDDREWCEKFKEYFGENCLRMDRRLPHYFENGRAIVGDKEKVMVEYIGSEPIRRKNTEYLVETFLLTRCQCLYATKGMGALLAYFMNNGQYKNVEFYENGKYSGLEKNM